MIVLAPNLALLALCEGVFLEDLGARFVQGFVTKQDRQPDLKSQDWGTHEIYLSVFLSSSPF